MKHMRIAAAVIGAIILLFVGCLAFGGPAGADTIASRQLVKDSMGREVTIPARPQRVVILNASNAELFCAAGGSDKIVGKPISKALADDTVKMTSTAEEIGMVHSPDAERILALKPDLVIGIDVPFHHALIPVLENAGIPLLIQALDTYEQVTDTLRFYGQLTGTGERAEQQVQAMAEQYQAAIDKAEGKTPPRTLIVWGSPESFSMATKESFVGDLAQRLGADNIADAAETGSGGFVPLSMEYVARANPEVIFLVSHSFDENVEKKFQTELASHPAWNGVRAVKERRVYALPYTLFAVNPGTRVAEALDILAEKMYAGEVKP